MKKIGYLSAFILPVLLVTGYYLDGWWNFLTAGFVFILEPVLDSLSGKDTRQLKEVEVNKLLKSNFFNSMLYGWAIAQIVLLGWAAYVVVYGHLSNWYEWTGFVISTSLITGGIGITVAHELGHRTSATAQTVSKMLLFTVGYMHFFIEHNKGHHKKVATPQDPATARKGESFYRFWLRSVIQGYRSAWHIENNRLQKKAQKALSSSNSMIWYSILPFLGLIIVFLVFSLTQGAPAWNILWFLPLQAIGGFTLLELVNYLEHYGLVRRLKENGKYERVNPVHSWNADNRLSNFLLFQLQRHSDHHAHASKPYQVLQHHEESPQLPTGYPTLVLMALVPPLWFSYMNPRLEQWQQATAI